jgi:hypothetical protein
MGRTKRDIEKKKRDLRLDNRFYSIKGERNELPEKIKKFSRNTEKGTTRIDVKIGERITSYFTRKEMTEEDITAYRERKIREYYKK